MRDRSLLGAMVLIGLVIPLTSCTSSPSLTSIVVSPSTMNFGGAGLTTQLTATGYYTHPGHPAITKDITTQVTWASSTTECVTVSSTGLITSGGNVCSNILVTASMPGFNGLIAGTMTVNVTQPSGGGGGGGGTTSGDVTSMSIIPATQSVATVGDTAQFIAVGTTSTGATVNLTNIAAWTSSSSQIAIVSTSGLATAVAQGTATITAVYSNTDGTVATGTASFVVTGGGSASSEQVTALTIIPDTEALSASGQTGQFIALGTSGSSGLSENVTSSSQLAWSSSIPSVATVTATGLAQGVSVGSTTITALWTNTDGSVVSASSTVSVNSSPAPEPLLSLTIVPSSITVGNLQDTGNFLAIGTFSVAPYVRDLTNSVNWISSFPNFFPVVTANSSGANNGVPAGTVTAYGDGTATIIAEATDPTTGSIQTATASFTCTIPSSPPQPGQCYQGSQAPSLLATVTVYNEGLNTTNWEVTGPSATGTPNVIHCGPGWTANGGSGGSVCVATYPVGTVVTLTAPATGAQFGGWSSSCTTINPNPSSAAGPNTCSFTIGNTAGQPSNITIGAIFN